MRIYLLRHGTADPRPPSGSDSADRQLVEKGQRQAKLVSDLFDRLGLMFDRVVSSPYARALQTAYAALTRHEAAVAQDERLAPSASVQQAVSAIVEHPVERVLAVGHEPLLSAVTSALTGGGQVRLKKGGLVELELISRDPLRAELLGLLRPAYLR